MTKANDAMSANWKVVCYNNNANKDSDQAYLYNDNGYL